MTVEWLPDDPRLYRLDDLKKALLVAQRDQKLRRLQLAEADQAVADAWRNLIDAQAELQGLGQ